jgi:hypothetical protein
MHKARVTKAEESAKKANERLQETMNWKIEI